MTQEKPCELYKYTTAEAAIKILTTSTVRFTAPECFNDPYDSCAPIQLKCDDKKIIEILKKSNIIIQNNTFYFKDNTHDLRLSINQLFSHLNKYFRVLCLSKTNKSILMWSHYANSHKGVVIDFSTDIYPITDAQPIAYNEFEILNLENLALFNNYTKHKVKEIDTPIPFIKYKDWEYEDEYRCSFLLPFYKDFLNKFNNKDTSPQWQNCYNELKNEDKYVHLPIAHNAIKAVYLGCKIAPSDEIAIIEILKTKYPHTKCYKAEKQENSFELKFHEINIE